jgi:hypothetical protein
VFIKTQLQRLVQLRCDECCGGWKQDPHASAV